MWAQTGLSRPFSREDDLRSREGANGGTAPIAGRRTVAASHCRAASCWRRYLHCFTNAGGGAGDHRRVHQAPQYRMTDRTARLSRAGRGPRRGVSGGGVTADDEI
jgi:hypothetical protein